MTGSQEEERWKLRRKRREILNYYMTVCLRGPDNNKSDEEHLSIAETGLLKGAKVCGPFDDRCISVNKR